MVELTDNEIARANSDGDRMFQEKLWPLIEQWAEDNQFDPSVLVHIIWVRCTFLLAGFGWTREKLINDVARCVALQIPDEDRT